MADVIAILSVEFGRPLECMLQHLKVADGIATMDGRCQCQVADGIATAGWVMDTWWMLLPRWQME